MAEFYPLVEPYDRGMLDTGDGNLVYWEVGGNPEGKPAVVVHGGPGSGCSQRNRRYFDPERYKVILFDQRGCGRSTPHAGDPATDMSLNTTHHLIADMERLREHLGVERWLLFGGSWGSTLILAYAERHPERVSEIVICGVTNSRRAEIDWLYHGVGRFFPEQWARFQANASPAGQGGGPTWEEAGGRGGAGGRLAAAYARLMADADPAVRNKAAVDWCTWEDAVVSMEPNAAPTPYGNTPPREMLAFVRIAAHYFAHGAWLEEGALLRDAGRLAGIPGILIHGRLDLSSPLETAWRLIHAWPDARLHVVDDSGHMGSDGMRDLIRTSLDEFAQK
ncbi:prolyl aminopeptidase [Nonomuraea sp. NPDC046570]|uniref:prolyl aminopeptidase n=1 Tax=Nonomuraea sp. NPDC046570 TaxID=3155255 RepID=UPI0033C83154